MPAALLSKSAFTGATLQTRHPAKSTRSVSALPTTANYVKIDNPYAKELKETAAYIAQRGKGILASDESNATTGKRLATIGVDNTEDTRRDWRQLLYTAPGLGMCMLCVYMLCVYHVYAMFTRMCA